MTIPAARFEGAAARCGLARLCLAVDRSDNEPRCIESSISAETLRPEAPLKELLYPEELVVAVDDIDMLFEAAVATKVRMTGWVSITQKVPQSHVRDLHAPHLTVSLYLRSSISSVRGTVEGPSREPCQDLDNLICLKDGRE